jgi:hypothetical protein
MARVLHFEPTGQHLEAFNLRASGRDLLKACALNFIEALYRFDDLVLKARDTNAQGARNAGTARHAVHRLQRKRHMRL